MPVSVYYVYALQKRSKKWKCSEKSEKITEILKRQKTPGAKRTSPWEAHSPLTRAPRGLGWAAPRGGEPTSCTASCRLFAYKLPPNLKLMERQATVHEKFRSAATVADEIRGTEVSVLAPCRDGELPPEPSPSTPPPSPSPLLTPMMRRE